MVTQINRNQSCACGSGKRYKHCCGANSRLTDLASIPANHLAEIKRTALEHHQANRLEQAEDYYRRGLTLAHDDADCLHMLGVVCLQTGRAIEAVQFISRAGELTGWHQVSMRFNHSLALEGALGEDSDTYARRLAYRMWCQHRAKQKTCHHPLVSIIVPSYNHAAYINDCLASVFAQIYRNIELIVIDDGSTDASATLIQKALMDCPFPQRFIKRPNCGAHATINEGLALARGDYVNILNSDDMFSPERIARMVDEVASTPARWGFSHVRIIDSSEATVPHASIKSRVDALNQLLVAGPKAITIGFGLLRGNFAITTGNIFAERRLMQELGGFVNLRYNHDWEFVIKATRESEPVYLADTLYWYRIHGHNTISESSAAPRLEAFSMINGYMSDSPIHSANPFAPTLANWGRYFTIERSILAGQSGLTGSTPPLPELQWAGEELPASVTPPISTLPFLEASPGVGQVLDYMAHWQPIDIPQFDQIQRYDMVAHALEGLRQSGQAFSILEVGANRHRNLGALLPHDRIVYLDVEVPDEMRGATDVVVGDATALDFADGHFDIVVALDVLEHIPTDKRHLFLRHISRVSNTLCIVAAPFEHPAVSEAETQAMHFWETLMHTPYRWLAEHAENGLPNLNWTLETLSSLGAHHWSIGHGRLDLWAHMLKGHFAAQTLPELKRPAQALDALYREHLFSRDFTQTGAYRHFIFCSASMPTIDAVQRHFNQHIITSEHNATFEVKDVLGILEVMQQQALESVDPVIKAPNSPPVRH